MLKFSYGWIDKWHNAKRGRQLGPYMGHRFHSLRLLELFSRAFITNSQEWRLHWRIMQLNILRKVFQFPFACRKLGINPLKGIIMFGWAGFLHGYLMSVKEWLHKSIMKKSDRAIIIISVTEWHFRSNSNCTINQGRYFICAFIP